MLATVPLSVTSNTFGKAISASEAAKIISDDDTVAVTGAGGGMLEPDAVFAAVEARYLAGEGPSGITFVHALGFGDRERKGTNRFAHEGLVKRVIGGHWGWSPRMRDLVREEKIEAYSLPSGAMSQLFREIGSGRPGLYTHVGLGTFVDPRLQGGRMNSSAKDELTEVVQVDGREYLRYKPFKIDVAIIRGSMADPDGNVSLDQEAGNLDVFALALAARNCGGKVIVQVRTLVARGSLPARSVRVPAVLVDAIVVDPDQKQNYAAVYDPAISGERRTVYLPTPQPFGIRKIIARRAADELRPGAVVNFGFGIPDGVAKLISERGQQDLYVQTVEHGVHGGDVMDGIVFGSTLNATAMIDSPSPFDFYSGGGLDIAFLGMGEFDAKGNVNVSLLDGEIVGPGGFIDISQNARKVVFCGTFDAKGAEIAAADGSLHIRRHGSVEKLVSEVAHVTFSGPMARERKQEVVYVTERAVFELRPGCLELTELAPGVDLNDDVLSRMGFTPIVRALRTMARSHFEP